MLAVRSVFLFSLLAFALGSPQLCRERRAVYNVTFSNMLVDTTFPDLPTLVFSPLTVVSHSNRVSLLTVRGFASPEIEDVAETGSNKALIDLARKLRREQRVVRSVEGADGPTMPGMMTTLKVVVNCNNPFITAVSMIAPSPDWIVQFNNMNTVGMDGMYVDRIEGELIAYDAGTDSGGMFTDPGDTSLDIPTEPPLNIAPLVEDDTDPFDGQVVGMYKAVRIE